MNARQRAKALRGSDRPPDRGKLNIQNAGERARAIRRCSWLSPTARLVAEELSDHEHAGLVGTSKRAPFPYVETVAAALSFSTRTVERAVKELKDAGVLTTQRTRGPARYFLFYAGFLKSAAPGPASRTDRYGGSEPTDMAVVEPYQEPLDRSGPAGAAVPEGEAALLGKEKTVGAALPAAEAPEQRQWPMIGEAKPRERWLTTDPAAESKGLKEKIGPVPKLP